MLIPSLEIPAIKELSQRKQWVLSGVDPDFDPDQRAFYYVRVIEIPKPRWTAYDAKFFNIKMPDDVAMTVQDRAYTSPIWYTP